MFRTLPASCGMLSRSPCEVSEGWKDGAAGDPSEAPCVGDGHGIPPVSRTGRIPEDLGTCAPGRPSPIIAPPGKCELVGGNTLRIRETAASVHAPDPDIDSDAEAACPGLMASRALVSPSAGCVGASTDVAGGRVCDAGPSRTESFPGLEDNGNVRRSASNGTFRLFDRVPEENGADLDMPAETDAALGAIL